MDLASLNLCSRLHAAAARAQRFANAPDPYESVAGLYGDAASLSPSDAASLSPPGSRPDPASPPLSQVSPRGQVGLSPGLGSWRAREALGVVAFYTSRLLSSAPPPPGTTSTSTPRGSLPGKPQGGSCWALASSHFLDYLAESVDESVAESVAESGAESGAEGSSASRHHHRHSHRLPSPHTYSPRRRRRCCDVDAAAWHRARAEACAHCVGGLLLGRHAEHVGGDDGDDGDGSDGGDVRVVERASLILLARLLHDTTSWRTRHAALE